MIKANKLKIDTTVRARGEAVRICAITKKKIGYHRRLPVSATVPDGHGYSIMTTGYVLDNSKLTYAPLSEVEPILLDVKYFEDLGYKHTQWEAEWNSHKDTVAELGELIELESPDRRIVVNNNSNRQSPYDWCVHVDNEDYETTGGLDIAYVHEFQGFLIDNDIQP